MCCSCSSIEDEDLGMPFLLVAGAFEVVLVCFSHVHGELLLTLGILLDGI